MVYKEGDKKYNKQRYDRVREFIRNEKKGKCCSKCNYHKHSEILEFHHVRGKKKATISQLRSRRFSNKIIKEEMDKCILLCPNCHMWLHESKRKDED